MSLSGFDAAVNAFQAGQADAIAGMTKTKEREKSLHQHLILTMIQKLSSQLQKAHKISKYDQLTGKTVGVKTEQPLNVFLEAIKDKYGFTIKTVTLVI